MTAPITIRPYQPKDLESLLQGHNQIFPKRSLEHWQWKFGDNPTGQIHTMVAAHEQEGIVGAYVTLPAHASIEGQRRIIGQCVDLWVVPQHRRVGPRPGVLGNVALAHHGHLLAGLVLGRARLDPTLGPGAADERGAHPGRLGLYRRRRTAADARPDRGGRRGDLGGRSVDHEGSSIINKDKR